VMTTWRRGQQIVMEHSRRRHGSLDDFVNNVATMSPTVQGVPGTAVFLNSNLQTAPPALLANVEHNHVLHRRTVTMSIQNEREPHVAATERLTARVIGGSDHHVVQLIAHFGYQDHPDVPATLRLALSQGLLRRLDAADVTYFLSRNRIERTGTASMNPWRKRLYLVMAHNAASQTEHFRLPAGQTVAMGVQIEI